ncbi:gluconeogenesis factor YvcK family protein [Streptomyces sp. QTS137]
MTARTPRLHRLRRVMPEGRATGRQTGARGARPRRRGAQPKVVALGGGMGLSASLAALRRITGDLTAVVTVADDGGSSGRLRDELGVLPPGDLRKALAALCGDDDWGQTWARVIQHRFQSKGELHEHAVGNLLIVALWEQLGDHVQALDLVGRLLGAHGRVLPMSAVPLELQALVKGHDPKHPEAVDTVRGQATVALTPGEVQSVHLVPNDPPAVPEAVEAVLDADWVVLGPGSWFSSVIPHLLVPELLDALVRTKARRVLSLNLAPQPGETEGFSPQRHVEVLGRHAPKLALDVVLADEAAVPDRDLLTDAAERLGAAVELAPVARPDGSPRHDPELLAAAYDRIFRMHGRIGPWR